MSLIFGWSPRDPGEPGALDRFSAILEKERAFYESLFGRPFHLELQRLHSACVGQIHFDSGVTGWQPCARSDEVGLLWSGICEQYLGVALDPAAIRDVVNRADQDPKSIAEWDGRFALCTWNAETQRVVLTPGAVESPALWHTEGPLGFAFGSRAAPLLEITGRRAQVDPDAASVYAAFEYLLGDTPLLGGVHRLRPRQQVIIDRDRRPVFRTYVSLADLLASSHRSMAWADRVTLAADRLTTRIRRQLQNSPAPILLLTGGHDSRCIAAAAIRAGYQGPACTSGPRDSTDVRIASQVVRRLGIPHQTSPGDPVRSLDALIQSPERLEQWVRWTEGVDVIRQALPYRAFFQRQMPFPQWKHQLFHGFGGELLRCNSFLRGQGALEATTLQRLEGVVRQRIPRSLVLRRSIDATLTSALGELAAEVSPGDVTPGQWLTLFTWQSLCLRWGTDMFSARDLIDWHWTPYMDRHLIRVSWDQSDEDRVSNRFPVDLARALAPRLAGVEYAGKAPAPPPAGILPRIQHARRMAGHQRIWKATLLNGQPRIWDQVVAREELNRLLKDEPASEPLWCLATAELAAKVFDAGTPSASNGHAIS